MPGVLDVALDHRGQIPLPAGRSKQVSASAPQRARDVHRRVIDGPTQDRDGGHVIPRSIERRGPAQGKSRARARQSFGLERKPEKVGPRSCRRGAQRL